MIKNIFVLVGGKGTRLGSLTQNTPKPLLKFNNKVFLDFIISKLLKLDTKYIYFACYYKSNQFFKNIIIKFLKRLKLYVSKNQNNWVLVVVYITPKN